MTSASRYSYGPWEGGPDPLAAPADLSAALDQIGRDVMDGASPQAAMRELLRRGMPGTRGMDELSRQLWQRRAEITRRHRLDGTLQQVRELLDRALTAERRALFPDPDDDARFREAQLDALPPDTARAVTELADYDWRSAEAAQAYQDIRDLLGQQLLEQRFEGIKQGLQSTSPEDVERIRQMLSDLTDLLAAHARGDPQTPQRFEQFMRQHGDYFPENPRTVDELIDALAARAAAAQRMLNSMTPQQRAEIAQLAQQAFGDPRLAQQLATLDAQLQGLRPGEDWQGSERFRGQDPLGLGEGAQAMADLSELDALAEQLAQSYSGARAEDIDLDAVARQLGDEARVDARRLAELERELERHGFFERAPDGSLRLSPKAMRRLGSQALTDVADALRGRRGEREQHRAGAAGEPTGATRPWEFGASEPWDVPRTVRNAVLRHAASSDGPLLTVEDVEVVDTEQRARAAVALCVDTSWSMVQDGHWVPMKRTALALHHLVRTRFRSDALELITFGRQAQRVDIAQLTGLTGVWEQGTNLHHALLLAGRHLRRHPDAAQVLLVVTDGEPTAHLEPGGEAVFSYPPLPQTLALTVREMDGLARIGTAVSIVMLGHDPKLAAFVHTLARRCGGRVLQPGADGLGAAVVGDYLRHRRRRA
ncbi:MAG TPA: VWA domain-containing protein [Pseudonocardiaceae bacterium]|nr:VWA domain-containing protein [Pseudonocardiaceae bacterium]